MDKRLISILIGIGLILGLLFYKTITISSHVAELECELDSITTIVNTPLPVGFDYVMERFSLYNPSIDTATVSTFIKVTTHLGLDKDDEVFKMLVGQICLESGAKQFYTSEHKKFGKVIRGTSGEVGMTQIMPNTAIGYLSSHMGDEAELLALGATDFSFVTDKSGRRAKMIQWLSHTDNNIILWGFMMRDNLEANGLIKGLVAYNAGHEGMRRFVKGNDPETHSYVMSIIDTLAYIECKLVCV